MTDNTLIPITEQSALEDLCGKLAESDFICVDTEFHRETTYWPELCLVQITEAMKPKSITCVCQ